MESINEIINPQTFSTQLVDETNDFIAVGHHQRHQIQECKSECDGGEVTGIRYVKPRTDTGSPEVLSSTMQTLIATTTDDSREEQSSCPVVMVIDEMGHTNVQTTYQIVPQQLQLQGGTCRTLPLSLLPLDQERHDHDHIASDSPVDFVGSDISLDGLAVSTVPAQIVAVKQEHKLVIVQRDDALNHTMNRRPSSRIDMNMSNINVSVIDEISSDDGVEEVTLNQHHQQLLEEQQQQQQHQHQHHQHQQHQHQHHHHHQQHQHHQQYGHRLASTSELLQHHQQNQRQQQRTTSVQLGNMHGNGNGNGNGNNGHHREALSVIVQAQEDDEDVDEDEEDDDRDSAGHLLSPALGVDNSLEHSTYQTLTSVNNRISPAGFSPTSYATLTPIQPLPPISTMSDKFAYAGHISGSGNSAGSANGSSVTSTGRINSVGPPDGTSNDNDCGSFSTLPMPMGGGAHQGSLGNLSLSGLGGVPSPYSSYDKLPSMISPPPHSYASSPSHGLSGMVGSCDLHTHSSSMPSPGVPGSGSGSGSPQLQVNVNLNVHKSVVINQGHAHGHMHGHGHVHGHGHGLGLGHGQATRQLVQKQVICLSPTSGMTDGIVVSDYESSYSTHQHDPELMMTTTHSSNNSTGRSSQLRSQHSPTLSPHSVSAGSVVSMSLHSPASVVTLPHMNGNVANLSVELPVVVALSPTAATDSVGQGQGQRQEQQLQQQQQQQHLLKCQQADNECNPNKGLHLANITISSNVNMCNINQQQQQQHHQNGFLSEQQQQQQQQKLTTTKSIALATLTTANDNGSSSNTNVANRSSGASNDIEEINTKELAQRISAELKRYSIPQAIFAQRVLCRSQGTLSDLLRNPKPWSKLKSGRETFRRMFKWLQEPEFQRMSALRMAAAQIPQRPASGVAAGAASGVAAGSGSAASGGGAIASVGLSAVPTSTTSSVVLANTAVESLHVSSISANAMLSGSLSTNSGLVTGVNCRRKEEPHIEQMPQPKKPRLVFTDLQRRTLQAIFKETKRPSKEMQVTIARQLGLEPTTVGNFFMNARRRSMDKWRDDDTKNVQHSHGRHQQHQDGGGSEEEERDSNNAGHGGHYNSSLHTTAMSPLGNYDDDGEMDLELEHHDFLVDHDDHDGDEHDDLL